MYIFILLADIDKSSLDVSKSVLKLTSGFLQEGQYMVMAALSAHRCRFSFDWKKWLCLRFRIIRQKCIFEYNGLF